MTSLNSFSLCSIVALAITLFISVSVDMIRAAENPRKNLYELSITFRPEKAQLIGTARISIEPNEGLGLFLGDLVLTGSLLQEQSGTEHQLRPVNGELLLPPAQSGRTLYISYTRTVVSDADNLISPQGISLLSNWYPVPQQPMRFHLTATLPDHFKAIVEADSFPLRQQGQKIQAVFSSPATEIHFIAGPYVIDKREVRKGLVVYSMFFKEDQELADGYLEAASRYLRHYEQKIGTFPYNHYVIVDNRQPTGYSMPTFTLLGQMVLRLPFIKSTSLGHEIVHQWFGNAVEVDFKGGNWCEGLTSFLADHAFREQQGEGPPDRRESITRYMSYVHKDSAIPLAEFTSASHNQPMAEAKRAVGYERGALFFYELRQRIGQASFARGLRLLYTENVGRVTSWQDVEASFTKGAEVDLKDFFAERLHRSDIPQLAIENITTDYGGGTSTLSYNKSGYATGTPTLSFDLLQLTSEPYSLIVPMRIKTITSVVNLTSPITQRKTHISIPLRDSPVEGAIDPDYTFFRRLTTGEYPAVWSRFLGSEKKLVILASEGEKQLYQPLLDSLKKFQPAVTTAAKVTDLELSSHDILFLGLDQPPSRALFALPKHPEHGFTLDVRHNPLNNKYVAVLISSGGTGETRAVARRLSHYGKYSYLEFDQGHLVTKKIEATEFGMHFDIEDLPVGAATKDLSSFSQLADTLAKAQVVYVGETHTSLADHLLQLHIIEALHQKNPRLAIGMEMFPASSQPALDSFTSGDKGFDERKFLKESDYYNVWSFDYRLYQGILNYARENHLPVIGLNLDRRIVSEVFRSGGTDSLSKKERESLPKDRNLDLPGYRERLSLMYGAHMEGGHGDGAASGFIQAQGLWDETMAENIAAFLASHPDYQLIVLAGSQHTRKDSGIPPRVARRITVQQASVVSVADQNVPADLAKVADYYFVTAPEELAELPRIGIVLDQIEENNHSYLKISQLSPHSKAAAAGLLPGDRVTEINGFAIANMADLRIAMLGTTEGQVIKVRVTRSVNGENRELLLPVELTRAPNMTEPHP